ncbi:hypothetical protein PATSB16_04590 [Pandoraea thiooxydans]|nr:hypothetical protein PATSB16_04590 [Pandoraea thiooxydans]
MDRANQRDVGVGAGKQRGLSQSGLEGDGWRNQLQALIDAHAGVRVNGKVASFRTRDVAATEVFAAFNTLRESLGFKLQSPRNLSEKHIQALVNHWYRNGRAVSTIRQNLSILRKFSGWIGKRGMVKSLPVYLPGVDPKDLRTSAIAERSRSWSENGVNVEAKIAEADALDEKLGLMLRMAVIFGLRRKELVLLKPWKADHGDALMIYANGGPKGGRPRAIPITTELQRATLDFVKARTPKTHHLGWYVTRLGKPTSLEYNVKEYLRWLEQLGITRKVAGVTGHGLRAEYAENEALLRGLIPATLGGSADQMLKEDIAVVQAQVSENMGHSRLAVTNSYYGSFKRLRREKLTSSATIRAKDTSRAEAEEQVHNFADSADGNGSAWSNGDPVRVAASIKNGPLGLLAIDGVQVDQSAQLASNSDEVQFPRLLAEIAATQESLDLSKLAQAMDLTIDEVNSLFERAREAWEAKKQGAARTEADPENWAEQKWKNPA